MPPRFSTLLLDARNVALIRLLQEDPRMPVSELARRIGMSAPAAKERLPRLAEAGVIRGVRLELDPKALGWPITVFVRPRPDHHLDRAVLAGSAARPAVAGRVRRLMRPAARQRRHG